MDKNLDNYIGDKIASGNEPQDKEVKNSYKSNRLIVFGFILACLTSVGVYFFISKNTSSNTVVETIANESNNEEFKSSTSTKGTTLISTEDKNFENKSDEDIEQEAIEISKKFTNNNSEGIIGFYEAYVEDIKFVEASSTPALTAIKNCLLNIYQNPSYSFTCYINGIQGLESTAKVTQKSPYLFLNGPAIKHRLIWIGSEQLLTATNITYNSESKETDSTLFVPEEYREDALGFVGESNISTRHDGRHFLGGKSRQQPLAHMVTYIDLDDPFSKHFYSTILELRELYSPNELAIEVQQLPLTQLHPNAAYLANGAHCAAEQGKEYYWIFIKGIFESRDGNSAFEMSKLPQLVSSIGLSNSEFDTCIENGHYKSVIVQQAQTIITTDAQGTPHTIIFNRITGESEPEVIEGARSISELTSVIDKILES